MELLLSELSTQIGHLFGSRHGTMASLHDGWHFTNVNNIATGVPPQLNSSHGPESVLHKHIQNGLLLSQPGYHGCGSIKGNREKFPKRKEKKRKRRDFLTYEYTFYW